MRHNLSIPVAISPEQRVPELTLDVDEKKLIQFIEDNRQLLADYLNIFHVPVETLLKGASDEMMESLTRFTPDQQREQIAGELAEQVWTKTIKPILINLTFEDIAEQAVEYVHQQHIVEVPFEDGQESRERLKMLVGDVITEKQISRHTVQMKQEPSYQILPEDLKLFLNHVFTSTVRDIYIRLDELELPLEQELYRFYFNDGSPTKFSLDMLERFQQGRCVIKEIVTWSLDRPEFWMQELLGNRSRIIDLDPNVSADEKLTQKASAYQLLKAVFLDQERREVEDVQ